MKKILFLLVINFITTSCDRIPLFQEEKTYYKFSENDYNFIPKKYETLNGSHIFISNLGESIALNNGGYNMTEEVSYPNNSLTQINYFENISINLNWNFLAECNNITIKISKSSNNALYYNLVFWTNNNGCNGIQQSFNTLQNFSQIQVGNKTYKNVIKMNLDNFYINVSNSKKVNMVYYDLENGLIGFQNTQTNEEFWLQ